MAISRSLHKSKASGAFRANWSSHRQMAFNPKVGNVIRGKREYDLFIPPGVTIESVIYDLERERIDWEIANH